MAGSWRSEPLPPNWGRIRRRILIRDDYKCQMLRPGRPGGLCAAYANQVDHVIQGGGDDDANLRSLCHDCHKTRSSSQGGQAFAAMRRRIAAQRFRPRERHPGLR